MRLGRIGAASLRASRPPAAAAVARERRVGMEMRNADFSRGKASRVLDKVPAGPQQAHIVASTSNSWSGVDCHVGDGIALVGLVG
jgi:hypothetical protein